MTPVVAALAAALLGASVFAATMVALYLASTVYHALPRGGAKRVFRVIEHGAMIIPSVRNEPDAIAAVTSSLA